jgi:hypothetical protein
MGAIKTIEISKLAGVAKHLNSMVPLRGIEPPTY